MALEDAPIIEVWLKTTDEVVREQLSAQIQAPRVHTPPVKPECTGTERASGGHGAAAVHRQSFGSMWEKSWWWALKTTKWAIATGNRCVPARGWVAAVGSPVTESRDPLLSLLYRVSSCHVYFYTQLRHVSLHHYFRVYENLRSHAI